MVAHPLTPLNLISWVNILLRHLLSAETKHAWNLTGVGARMVVCEGIRLVGTLQVVKHKEEKGFGAGGRGQVDGEK